MSSFEEHKAKKVAKAEASLRSAEGRLERALRAYGVEVELHEERGDGFFSSSYLLSRREAVLASKHFESRRSALNTARAELVASTISSEWPES